MIVITGATGNIGSRITETLLGAGKKVRVIGRNADKLQPFVDKGAEASTGSLEDEIFTTEAFTGATSVFAMIPTDFVAENVRDSQNRSGYVTAKALHKAGVPYVVNLSSLGAHLSENTGPILGLRDQEQRLNKLDGINIIHLRPTFFMENLLGNLSMIKNDGVNGSPLKADLVFPLIATQDIAKVAGEYLLNTDFTGKSFRELVGPKNLSMNEITGILGKAIGKDDLTYVQFSYEDTKKALVDMGLSDDVAESYNELYRWMNSDDFGTERELTDDNTTETSFEEFAEYMADLYKSG